MNKQLSKGDLLDENGNLNEAGFSYSLIRDYHRNQIKAKSSRIKEWDYYYIGNAHYAIALTVADNSYMWMVSVSLLDFGKKTHETTSPLGFFSFGKLHLPETSNADVKFIKKNKFSMQFLYENGNRHLICELKKFGKKKENFRCDLILKPTLKDSMVIATPFNKPGHFYYNQKINCLAANGYAKVGETMYDFNEKSFAVLDWGRGVWTYKNTWYWSSLNSIYKGHIIGWNLGYGFGDTSNASENMVFYDGVAYKLDDVRFDIPISKHGGDDFLSNWSIRSTDGSINIAFKPLFDRHSDSNVLVIRSNQHQIFGVFSGSIKVSEDKTIYFDNLIGFAEKVYNRW